MPTILRWRGYGVRVYPNDHAPPHVRVAAADGMARIALGEGEERPRLLSVAGMGRAAAAEALRLVAANREPCRRRWREIHGEP